ncbi:hypothetical protein X798_04822 [Onchocerca flexuosa]|uniref:Uncharacterized protein n=1 Tax=Onchocerca flexuosa TaxID=387005 RepID=A0A238BRW4_9BILA|nr:hypothetical protein X798_04822 [Onchocerca flexuosa]
MMNGQIRQAMLVDDQDLDGTTIDTLPKSMQFNESSENYRCFCNCFHIKSGALIVAGTELLMLIIFLINSLVIIVEHDIKDDKVAGTCDSYVIKSFAASMVCIALSFLAVLLLFAGIIRNTATFLIPHLIVQVNNCIQAFCDDLFCFFREIILIKVENLLETVLVCNDHSQLLSLLKGTKPIYALLS